MLKTLCLVLLLFNIAVGENVTYMDLVEKTTMLKSCLRLNVNNSLLLAGDFTEFLKDPVVTGNLVALMDESRQNAFEPYTLTRYSFHMYQSYNFHRLLYRLEFFVVVAGSQPSLKLLLQRIKESTWANAEGFHVIVDRRTEERGCAYAYRYLWTAWKYDLISAVFICIDPVDGIVLYSYNPYSSMSPAEWTETKVYDGRRGHPWRLLKRKYDSNVCKSLTFDKTSELSGYEIRLNALAQPPLLKIDRTKEKYTDMFDGESAELIKFLCEKINASMHVMVYNVTPDAGLGVPGINGTMTGLMADISSGRVDMGMNVRSLVVMWQIRYTYPHAQGGYCVITQPVGRVSELKKILTFASPNVIVGVIIVCVIMHLVLARREGHALASLNVIRLAIGVSLHRPPTLTSSRIFLMMTVILLLIISALFEGNWASLLTAPMDRPNIDTIKDLQKSGYLIYGARTLGERLGDPTLKSRYRVTTYNTCKEDVLRSRTAACLAKCLPLLEEIRHDSLHISGRILEFDFVYPTRQDWPLYARVKREIRAMDEAGLVSFWRNKHLSQIVREKRIREAKEKDGFKVLTLKNLAFGFYLLGFGYVCSILVFLAELWVHKRKLGQDKRVKRPRRMLGHVRQR